jgi:small GTP-binding protein
VQIDGKNVKLQIWDTAGQERFRTLTSSYYRGAHAIVFAYDVTRRETFDSLEDVWMREVELYGTVDAAARMVVGNKTDRAAGEREVSAEEGAAFARRHGCLFAETSAKAGKSRPTASAAWRTRPRSSARRARSRTMCRSVATQRPPSRLESVDRPLPTLTLRGCGHV